MNKKVQLKIKKQKNKTFPIFIFLLFMFLGASSSTVIASDNSSKNIKQLIQQKRISLSIKDKSVKFILSEIQKMTGIGYLIKDEENTESLKKLSIDVKDITIEQALSTLFAGTGFTYKIDGNIIVVTKLAKTNSAKQQTTEIFSIDGVVVGAEDHKAIPGATVIVVGTASGDITDINGQFRLMVQKGQEIEISYMGLITQIVKITNNNKLNIVMKGNAMALDNVVITGYSNIKQSGYTGNAVTVKRDDLLKASKTNVIKALQSFDPSFRIKDNNLWGSDPNALPEMTIRGSSSFGKQQASFNSDGTITRNDLSKSNLQENPNLPTFIMDGFEISATKLYDFDPNRIESVTILKDAAATALYGSRAANGVVIITTVVPKAGKLNVAYNFVGSVSLPDLSDYDLMNAAEKLETERRAGYFTWDADRNHSTDDPYRLQREYYAKRQNVLEGVDTYWLSKPLRAVFNHKHTLYVDGGTENLRFGIDLQFNNQDGVMKGSARDNYAAGFYLQYNYKNLSIKNYASYQITKSTESPYGNFSEYSKQLPYDKYEDETGKTLKSLKSWGTASNRLNPLYESSLYNYNNTKKEELINNLILNWNLTPDLLLKGQLSLTKTIDNNDEFYDPQSLNTSNRNHLGADNISSGTLYLRNSDAFVLDFNATLSYNKNIKEHSINAVAGISMRESVGNNDNATYLGFPSGALSSPQFANKMYEKTGFSEATSRLAGFLFSANYTFKNIYLLDASVRIDGSSNFGSEKRFAPFWSVGAGLNLHRYDFMSDIKWINMLKIRGSYGQTGKANFSAYQARTTFKVLTDEWYKTGYGAELKGIGNSNLSWETTNTYDVGAEMQLFDNLLYIKGSYYDKRTIDLVNSVTVPSSSGFSTYSDNVGEVSNKGYEFNLRVQAINRKDISLIINANVGHNKNRLEKISESQKAYNKMVQNSFNYFNDVTLTALGLERVTPFLQYEEGGSLSSIYGVKSMGINPADGNEVYMSRMGVLTNRWVSSDQTVLGNTDPKAQGSFGFSFTYKQFNLYSSFMYEFGGQRFNQTLMDKVENANVYATNVDKRVLTDRWQKPGDNAKYKKLQYNKLSTDLTKPTSRFVQDYNVLSFSSIELSYDFTSNITEKLGMSMLRLTIGMNDIFNISSVKQERGLSYPFARSFNFSVKASF